MNWINDNKKQAVFIANIEHWHPGDVYEVIEASIVREKVGETLSLDGIIEFSETCDLQLKHVAASYKSCFATGETREEALKNLVILMHGAIEHENKELAAAKAEVLQFAEWCSNNGFSKIGDKWHSQYYHRLYTTDEIHEIFKKQQ